MEQTNTLAELAEMKIDIVAWCNACRANRKLRSGEMATRYGAGLTVRRFALRLRCSKCGARDCEIRLAPRGVYPLLPGDH